MKPAEGSSQGRKGGGGGGRGNPSKGEYYKNLYGGGGRGKGCRGGGGGGSYEDATPMATDDPSRQVLPVDPRMRG